jgi:hypothetical protein
MAYEPYPGSGGAAEQAEQADRRFYYENQAAKAKRVTEVAAIEARTHCKARGTMGTVAAEIC